MKIITLLIIATIVVITYKRIHSCPLKCLSDEQRSNLYRLMERVDRVCRDHDIPYFIIAGTLLGSVRHSEMIPWDDDIDIGIMKQDLKKLQAVDLSAYGIEAGGVVLDDSVEIKGLSEHNIGKLFFPEHYGNGKKMESIFIDVFVYEQVDDKIQFTYEHSRKFWPKEYFYVNEVFPLREYVFGDLTLSGPNQYEPYARRVWGNWKAYPNHIYLHILYYPEKIRWLL